VKVYKICKNSYLPVMIASRCVDTYIVEFSKLIHLRYKQGGKAGTSMDLIHSYAVVRVCARLVLEGNGSAVSNWLSFVAEAFRLSRDSAVSQCLST